MPPKKNNKRKKMADSYNYCDLLGIDEIPKKVTSDWCKCNSCYTGGEILPKDAVCCATIRKSKTNLAKNWLKFVGKHDGCFATHPKISWMKLL